MGNKGDSKMKKLFSLVLVMFFVACGGSGVSILDDKIKVCDNIPEGSYSVICDISDEIGRSPEDAAKILRMSNIAGLASNVYTAQQALDFIKGIKGDLQEAQGLEGGLLYSVMIEYVNEKYSKLPDKVKLSIALAREFIDFDINLVPTINLPLSDYDFEMLYMHLDDQIAIVSPFLLLIL